MIKMNKYVIVISCLLIAEHTASVIDLHEWNAYKSKFLKNYQNQAEERSHMETFLKHKDDVLKHNQLYDKGLVSFSMSLNAYSDIPHTEFVSRMNGARHEHSQHSRQNMELHASVGMAMASLPKAIDWRNKGAVSSVEKQGMCGSCWAFSVLGALEAQNFRKTGHLVALSAQNLVDCANNGSLKSKCNGHSRTQAMDYIKKNGGVDSEKSYPYKATGGSCKYNSRNSAATLSGYKWVAKGDEMQLQHAIATVGPISVNVDAKHESFQHYNGGIYFEPKCHTNNLDHSVLVVGYGTDKHGDYFILKNSWGQSWGENGYMRLARNRNNHCGIATEGVYPVI